MNKPHKQKFLTTQEAAQYLRVKLSWIRNAVQRRAIPHTKVGRLLRFPIDKLNAWLEANSTDGGGK